MNSQEELGIIKFDESLERLESAQRMFRELAGDGEAPPYFISNFEVGKPEGQGLALITIDKSVQPDRHPGYGSLFAYDFNLHRKSVSLTQEPLPLLNRASVIQALGQLSIHEGDTLQMWLTVTKRAQKIVARHDWHGVFDRSRALTALGEDSARRLLPKQGRRMEVISKRAENGESHTASFSQRETQSPTGATRLQYDRTYINELTGRHELHIMDQRYHAVFDGGTVQISYELARPLVVNPEEDLILVRPDEETAEEIESLYKTFDQLATKVSEGECMFGRFEVRRHPERGYLTATINIPAGDKRDIYYLSQKDIAKLRIRSGNDILPDKFPAFFKVLESHVDDYGKNRHFCTVVGPEPKETPLYFYGGRTKSKVVGCYAARLLGKLDEVESVTAKTRKGKLVPILYRQKQPENP